MKRECEQVRERGFQAERDEDRFRRLGEELCINEDPTEVLSGPGEE